MAQPRNQLWPFSERFENDRISDGTESTQLESEVCGDRRERNKIDGCISNRLATWCYCWGGSGTGMLLQLVVGALLCVNVSYTSTHWVVSDDGRLKSVVSYLPSFLFLVLISAWPRVCFFVQYIVRLKLNI